MRCWARKKRDTVFLPCHNNFTFNISLTAILLQQLWNYVRIGCVATWPVLMDVGVFCLKWYHMLCSLNFEQWPHLYHLNIAYHKSFQEKVEPLFWCRTSREWVQDHPTHSTNGKNSSSRKSHPNVPFLRVAFTKYFFSIVGRLPECYISAVVHCKPAFLKKKVFNKCKIFDVWLGITPPSLWSPFALYCMYFTWMI